MRNCKRMPYAQIIRWRIRVSYALLVLMLAYMVLVAEMGGGDSRRMTDLASAVSRLLFFGGFGVVVSRIVHNKRLLRDRARCGSSRCASRTSATSTCTTRAAARRWTSCWCCCCSPR